MRTQLARPNERLLTPEAYNQLFSMHGITMIFLFVTPMLSGFGNYFVPLMIGARDMAFPRLNALGYWVFLASGLFMYSSLLIGSAPDAGWFSYAPLRRWRHGSNHRLLRPRADLPRDLVDRGRDQFHRHDHPPARSGHVAEPDAALLLGDACDVAVARLRRAVADRGLPAARAVTQVGLPLLRQRARRRRAAVAAPVLDLRASGRLHHLPAGGRDRLDDHPGLLAPADGRAAPRRARDDGDRVSRLRRLGAPHVRRRSAAGDDDVLRGGEHGDRDPERHSGLRLARDDHRRPPRPEDAVSVRRRLHRRVRDRRAVGRHVRGHPLRPAGDRLVLRRRALPLRPVRRGRVPDPRGDPLLAAEDHAGACSTSA